MKTLVRSFILVAAAAVAGCGDKDARAPVSGKVTVAGKGPLAGGSIRFVSAADPNRSSSGQIKSDGTYMVPDAPVGECKVVIDNSHLDPNGSKGSAPPGAMGKGGGMKGMPGAGPGAGGMPGAGGSPSAGPAGAPKADDKAKMGSAPKGAGAEVPNEMNDGRAEHSAEKFVKIDGAFTKPETTTLTFTVVKGENTKDFDVK
jgi:hypothetical protein